MWKRALTHAAAAGTIILVLASGLTASKAAAQKERSPVEAIRHELLQLPYYGVFDFLGYTYERGTLTLLGYAYHKELKTDAVRAAKRARGVDTVIDKIELLPSAPQDDDLRWKVYYAVYSDAFISRYVPGGPTLWGHSHDFTDPTFRPFNPPQFPGMEPAGNLPVHIIVKGGRVMLLGVVESEMDKTAAGLAASHVPGVFNLQNDLMVEPGREKTGTR